MAGIDDVLGYAKDNASELTQLGIGIGQSIKANRLKRNADKIPIPDLYDPLQTAYLGKIQRLREQVSAGTDSATSVARNLVAKNSASLAKSLFKTGGSVFNVQSLLRQVGRQGSSDLTQLAGGITNREMGLLGAEGQQANVMSKRASDTQWWKKIQALREWAELKNTANVNIGASTASLTGSLKN